MADKRQVTAKLSEDVVEDVEEYQDAQGFDTRQFAIETLLREALDREEEEEAPPLTQQQAPDGLPAASLLTVATRNANSFARQGTLLAGLALGLAILRSSFTVGPLLDLATGSVIGIALIVGFLNIVAGAAGAMNYAAEALGSDQDAQSDDEKSVTEAEA